MEVILLLCGLAAAFVGSAALLKKNEIIENSILAFAGYWCIYIIVSGLLFWCDRFKISMAAGITLGLELVLIGISWKEISFSSWHLDIRGQLFPLLVCVILLPFISDKFELYGMGQDEGVYQTQAIAFLYGDTKNQHDIPSYGQLPESVQEEYKALIERKLVGFYRYDETLPTLQEADKISEVSGFYHGVPTFSAVLALWGCVAGMEHMAGIQNLLYFCAVFLIFYIGRHLGLENRYRCAGVFVFAASPMVIWVCKSTLTEMMLTVMILLFLYFLSEKPEKRYIFVSALPILAFSFFHITIYTVIPALVLLYFLLYLYEGKREYPAAVMIVLFGFVLGIRMMSEVAATYSFVYNFLPLYQLLGFIDQENVLTVLTIGGIAGLVLAPVVYICLRKRVPLREGKGTVPEKAVIAVIRLVTVLMVVWNGCVILKEAGEKGLGEALRFSTIIGYGLFAGVILLICAIFGMIIQADKLLKNRNDMLFGFFFFYFVLIYGAVFRKQIPYYYYYGRYLVPYIPCIILLGYMVIDRIKTKWIKVGCYGVSILASFAMAVVYDPVLMKEKDDTRLSWQVLKDCSEIFDDNDNIILDKDLATVLYLPLMHMTEAQEYLQYGKVMDEQLKDIGAWEETADIYFITDEFYGADQWESVYIGSYEKSEAAGENPKWLPFPLEMKKEQCKIYVYRYYPEQTEYRLGEKQTLTNNFYGIEGDARWTNGNGVLYCYLEPAEYELRIQQGARVPLEELGRESMNIRLYLNGTCADEYILDRENVQEDMVFHVKKEEIQKGRNEVMLVCEPWSPADLGRSDTRDLGISIRTVIFAASQEKGGRK